MVFTSSPVDSRTKPVDGHHQPCAKLHINFDALGGLLLSYVKGRSEYKQAVACRPSHTLCQGPASQLLEAQRLLIGASRDRS